MSKVATKPKKLVTTEVAETNEEVGHSEQTLVSMEDHKIVGCTLHHDFDGVNQTFNGILDLPARQIAFEATFNTKKACEDKKHVRDVLIEGSVYTDDGSSAAGHVAMNASFKKLLAYVMGCLNEQEAQTA